MTILYWIYLRVFVPINDLMDLVCEVLCTLCDIGVFVCGLLLAIYDPTDSQKM